MQDLILKFTITDNAGAPLVIDDLAGLEITIITKDAIVQKFTSPVTVVSEDGTVKVNVDRANLSGYEGRVLYAEVKVKITNAAFADGEEWRTETIKIENTNDLIATVEIL